MVNEPNGKQDADKINIVKFVEQGGVLMVLSKSLRGIRRNTGFGEPHNYHHFDLSQ